MQVGSLAPYFIGSFLSIGSTRRNIVVTTLLLLDIDDLRLLRQCLDSVRRGLVRIDKNLVFSLYSAGDQRARLAIACSAAASRLNPHAFRQIFDPVYSRPDLSMQQRRHLMWNLETFLSLNPRQGPAYERIILDLAHSPHLALSVRGIPMAARFARIDASMLALLKRQLKSRSPHMRLTTVNSFRHMVDRLDQLAPDIRVFIASDVLRKEVARMHRSDPDDLVRKGTWVLLKKFRDTLGPVSRAMRKSQWSR